MKNLFLKILLLGFITSNIFAAVEDDPLLYRFSAEKFEITTGDDNPFNWDVDFMIGKDLNKFYLYSEGTYVNSEISESENSIVYSRAITSLWDFQSGLAYDTVPNENNLWLTFGFQGLAPYFFESRVNFLIDDDGNIGLRADLDYDLLLTQKLILTPSLATSLYTKNNEKMEIGSGLSSTSLSLMLRYEFVREFAPYIGVQWDKTYGNTKEYEDIDNTEIVVGIRFWF